MVRMLYAALVFTGILYGQASEVRAQRYFNPSLYYRAPIDGAASRGPTTALITIVEFSDFSCRYCRVAQERLQHLRKLYPKELRLVFRHNPLDIEDGSLAAEAAEAARAQGKFWAMHDRLFASTQAFTRSLVESHAREIGLDLVGFRSVLDTRSAMRAIRKDTAAAAKLGITSTPTFFINGRPIRGAMPLSVLVPVIEEELKTARALAMTVGRERLYEKLQQSALPRGATTKQAPHPRRYDLDAPKHRFDTTPGLPGHQLGPDDAPITIVEFSDFECHFCTKVVPRLRRIVERYPDKVKLIYRHLPLRIHPNAYLAAEAAIEAGLQGKFWPFHDQLFRHKRLPYATLLQAARAARLDMSKFQAALDDRRHATTLHTRIATASSLGIQGTPTMFINGIPAVGALSERALVRIVERELAAANVARKRGVPADAIYQTRLRSQAVAKERR